MYFKIYKKIWNKYVHIGNGWQFKVAKYPKCYVFYATQIRKKYIDMGLWIVHLQILSVFCLSWVPHNTKYFRLINCALKIYIIIYMHICFPDFFETYKYCFRIFKIKTAVIFSDLFSHVGTWVCMGHLTSPDSRSPGSALMIERVPWILQFQAHC